MIVLFNNGPLQGRFATVQKVDKEIRCRYLKDGEGVVALYRIGENVAAATRHTFAAASYVGDIESRENRSPVSGPPCGQPQFYFALRGPDRCRITPVGNHKM